MKALGWIIAAIFLAGALVAGCVAWVNDEDSMAPVRAQLAYHERSRCYDDYDCEDGQGDYGGYGSDYGHNRRDDRNRNRGAFSPGPFEDSPVDAFNGNTICLPGSYCTPDDRQRDDEEQR